MCRGRPGRGGLPQAPRVSSPRPRAPGVPEGADDHGEQRCHRAVAPPAAPRIRAGLRPVCAASTVASRTEGSEAAATGRPPLLVPRRCSFHAAAHSGRRHTTAARLRPLRVPQGTSHARHPPRRHLGQPTHSTPGPTSMTPTATPPNSPKRCKALTGKSGVARPPRPGTRGWRVARHGGAGQGPRTARDGPSLLCQKAVR